jgi:hypothetical protein
MMDGTKKAEADALGFCVVAGCLFKRYSCSPYSLTPLFPFYADDAGVGVFAEAMAGGGQKPK